MLSEISEVSENSENSEITKGAQLDVALLLVAGLRIELRTSGL